MRIPAAATLALLAGAAGAAAQSGPECRPGAGSNEARAMAIFDVPLAYGLAAAPDRAPPGRVRIGMEVAYLPNVDAETATPRICRPDKPGPENTDLLFAAPRPRLLVQLPAGFALEASWTPPLRVAQVKANLGGVALSWTGPVGRRGVLLGLRAHAAFGVIHAPITCDDDALADASSPCYQGTRSNDAFHPNVAGLEAVAAWPLGARLRPFLGAGYNRLAPRFRVNFTNQFGDVDRTRVIVDLNRAVLFAGATWRLGRLLDLSGAIYSAPSDAVTARLTGRIRLGR